MRKTLLVLLVVLIVLSPLAAQGQKAAPVADPNAPMELTILYDYEIPQDAQNKLDIEKAFNVKIDAKNNKAVSTDENVQKLQLMIASGEKIDQFIAYDYNMLKKFAEQGVIAEVPIDLIKEAAPRMYAYLMKIDPGAWAFTNVNGKNYGFPTAWPLGDHSRVMSIRVDWLEKLGMKIPTTLADLEKALYAFHNNDPDGNGKKDTYGLSFYSSSSSATIQAFNPIFGAYGVHPYLFQVKDGKFVYGGIQPEIKDVLAQLNKWYKDGVIDPSFFVDNYNTFQEKWINGKFGLIPDTWWWTAGPSQKYYSGALYDPVLKANPNAKPTTIAPPIGPSGAQGMAQRTVFEVIPFIVFGKHLENDQAKMRRWFEVWDELLSTEKWSVKLYHGDEGVTYKRGADNAIEWIPPYDNAEKRQEYGMNYFSMVPNYDIYDTATKDGAWIAQERGKAIGPMDAISNYPLAAWTKYRVNLDTIMETGYVSFITGQRPLSEFDAFVTEWLNSGGKEVIAEATDVYTKLFKK